MKHRIYRCILAVAGLVLIGVGGFVPASIYFPEVMGWAYMVVGFAAVGYAAHLQIVRR